MGADSRAVPQGQQAQWTSRIRHRAAMRVSVGIPLLLVSHQRAVVTEDVHGVLPMPAGATVVFEAGLGKKKKKKKY